MSTTNEQQWQKGERVRIRWTDITGTVRSVNTHGDIGVDGDDGDVTEDGEIHPSDVDPE